MQDWAENSLHTAKLKPTLEHREAYPWQHRHVDTDLWSRPPALFDPHAPVTIHLAGDRLEDEQFLAATRDYQRWKANICVDSMQVITF